MSGRPGRAPARVVVAFGTRPEASKMAPVVHALARHAALEPLVLVTGQHREQLDRMLEVFELRPDADLALMRPGQGLADTFGRIVPAAAEALTRLRPDYVLVHGDTLTTVAVALAAYFGGHGVAHVEAGLRSFDLQQPFPEEANRRLTDVVTDLDLPPTPLAARNLRREGKEAARMVVTGNTAVDAVRWASARAGLPERLVGASKLITITMHRRENLPVMAGLAQALAEVAGRFVDHLFVYPMHRNPLVRDAVVPVLGGLPNVRLEDDFDYLEMLALLRASRLVVTDSGGLQEEGAALGVPVAVLRNVTERPEGIEAGTMALLGNEPGAVRARLEGLLGDEAALDAMRAAPNPYGDGVAGERVAAAVAWRLGLGARPEDWVPEPRLRPELAGARPG